MAGEVQPASTGNAGDEFLENQAAPVTALELFQLFFISLIFSC